MKFRGTAAAAELIFFYFMHKGRACVFRFFIRGFENIYFILAKYAPYAVFYAYSFQRTGL